MKRAWAGKLVGIIFLLAAAYRIIFYKDALIEVSRLGLPAFMSIVVIIIELAIGSMLLAAYKPRLAAIIGIGFLCLAILWAFINRWQSILSDSKELFVFDATPTDILLHGMYIVLLIMFLDRLKKE
jgi:uncharacterized membrane protein YphA (DoxX/SURF4 family)